MYETSIYLYKYSNDAVMFPWYLFYADAQQSWFMVGYVTWKRYRGRFNIDTALTIFANPKILLFTV